MKVFIRSSSRRREGTATIVVLALLGIVLLFLGINAQSISNLQRELKVLDQQQTQRLRACGGDAKAEKVNFRSKRRTQFQSSVEYYSDSSGSHQNQ